MTATVLVVEDEPAIQELIAYTLKQAGHQPLRADTAEHVQRRDSVRQRAIEALTLRIILTGWPVDEYENALDRAEQTIVAATLNVLQAGRKRCGPCRCGERTVGVGRNIQYGLGETESGGE